ncbi:MAG: porin [Muribaculaceae bacterium]
MQRLSKIVLFLVASLCTIAAKSQETKAVVTSGDPSVSLKIDTRLDGTVTTYGGDYYGGSVPETQAGFEGTYLKMIVNGRINERFSYSFRHRMYKDNGNPKSFFNSTDWVNLTYAPDDRYTITVGKQVVLVGTEEYDYAPIDVYFASYYWNHCNPYQIGVNIGYRVDDGNQLYAQMTNSPYSTESLENMFAYNLMWYGTIAPWLTTKYSVNMMEYQKGRYINYIALGHRIAIDRFSIDIDYMNRYAGHHTKFFKDFTVSSKIDLKVGNRFNLFAKGGYDQNKAQGRDVDNPLDTYVLPGTSRGFWGCGVEYSPIVDRRNKVRFHAYWHSSSDDMPSSNTFTVGVRWQMDVFDLKF